MNRFGVFAIPDGGLATNMSRGTNSDSVLALDKRIEEMTAELIQLKRSRNSLLGIARISPEVLGYIFRLSVIPGAADGDFAGLRKDPRTLLLVSHHWSEVARRTPELWSFWGNSLEDWKRQYPRSGTFPLDLVLDGLKHQDRSFDGDLQEALSDYATRDTIRKVHLRGGDAQLLTNIVSTLTPEEDGTRDSSIESIVLEGVGTVRSLARRGKVRTNCVDASGFLSRHHFLKLQDLTLSGRFTISSEAWACLKSHTTALVNLSLAFDPPLSFLTTSQIVLLLASNPNIRNLTLALPKIDDSGSGSGSRVPLRHLENLFLRGEPHRAFQILRQLELPERVDRTKLVFSDHTPDEVREAIVPQIRDYLHRDPRSKDRLGISVWVKNHRFFLRASVVGVGYHGPDRLPQRDAPHMTFITTIWPRPAGVGKFYIDILALLPRESIVYFQTDLPMTVTKEVIVAMPNLEALYLVNAEVSVGFMLPSPDGPNEHANFLPSLQRLYLHDAHAKSDGWNPLVRYVTHQNSGDHPFSLNLYGDSAKIRPGLVEQIEGLVEEFVCGPGPRLDRPLL